MKRFFSFNANLMGRFHGTKGPLFLKLDREKEITTNYNNREPRPSAFLDLTPRNPAVLPSTTIEQWKKVKFQKLTKKGKNVLLSKSIKRTREFTHMLPFFGYSPRTFPQTVLQSDGSTITLRVCTPKSFLALGKDTRNHVLWNPERKSAYDEEAVQVTKFASKYGDLNLNSLITSTEEEAKAPKVEKSAKSVDKKKK